MLDALEPINKDTSRSHRLYHAGPVVRDLQHMAIFEQENAGRIDADASRQVTMPHEIPVLSMNRNEVAWSYEVEHQLQFVLACMSRDMNACDSFIDNLGAASMQMVDQPSNRPVVPWNHPRRQYNDISIANLDLRVITGGDARQGGERFALRPCREQRDRARI